MRRAGIILEGEGEGADPRRSEEGWVMLVTAEVGTCALVVVPIPPTHSFLRLLHASHRCGKNHWLHQLGLVGQGEHQPRADTVVLGPHCLHINDKAQGRVYKACSVNAGGVVMALNHAALSLSVSLPPELVCGPLKSWDQSVHIDLLGSTGWANIYRWAHEGRIGGVR